MTTDRPLIEIQNLKKSFGALEVLQGVSASLPAGQVLSLIGPSGSGKTTLLRCINFLEEYDGGEIRIGDTTVGYRIDEAGRRTRRPEREIAAARAEASMVFQSYNLFPHMTVMKNITAAPLKLGRTTKDQAEQTARELLAKVGLSEKENAFPSELSGGQQQRVAIARALAMKPQVLLFDEVTSALDPELVGEVLSVIRELADEGLTMIIVTHEMRFAFEVSNLIAFMDKGKIVEFGSPSYLMEESKNPRLNSFLERYRGEH